MHLRTKTQLDGCPHLITLQANKSTIFAGSRGQYEGYGMLYRLCTKAMFRQVHGERTARDRLLPKWARNTLRDDDPYLFAQSLHRIRMSSHHVLSRRWLRLMMGQVAVL
jgi:hypothetical protein